MLCLTLRCTLIIERSVALYEVCKVHLTADATVSGSPMSMKSVSEFGVSAIDSPHEAVRAAGTRLMILIYPEDRGLVRQLLPADGKKTRKSLTYRTLLNELDRLDSKVR